MTAPQTSRLSDAAWNPQKTGSAGTQQGPTPLVSHDPAHLPGRKSTAGDASGVGRCDYAHCDERRVWKSDGWLFCARHYLEHRSLFHGARWPHNRGTYDPNITELVGKDVLPCGTAAAHKRHMRRGEQPCEECRQAYNRMRVDGDRRRRAQMREAS